MDTLSNELAERIRIFRSDSARLGDDADDVQSARCELRIASSQRNRQLRIVPIASADWGIASSEVGSNCNCIVKRACERQCPMLEVQPTKSERRSTLAIESKHRRGNRRVHPLRLGGTSRPAIDGRFRITSAVDPCRASLRERPRRPGRTLAHVVPVVFRDTVTSAEVTGVKLGWPQGSHLPYDA